MTLMKMQKLAGMLLASLCGSLAFGLDWDTSTASLFQHGDGLWSDAKWTSSGTRLGIWTNGNSATFNATVGSSTIQLDGIVANVSGMNAQGDNYHLIVTNGGMIAASGNYIWGYGSTTPTNNTFSVIGGPGRVSSLSNVGSFWVGYSGNNNALIVDGCGVAGSAVVSNSGTFMVGYTHASSKSSRVTVRRGGRLVVTGGNVIVGRSGDFQQMTIADGGSIEASPVYVGNTGGHANTLNITDPNTVIDRVAILYLANDTYLTGNKLIIANGGTVTNVGFRIGNTGCIGNMLSITNGGKLYTSSSPVNIGYLSAVTSTGLVSGVGSLWDLGGKALEIGDVGQSAASNVLLIADGACVTNISLLTVVSLNSLMLLGGSVSAGQVALNAGSVTAVGIAGDAGPGDGWGRLASSGTHVLGGTLKPVLLSNFEPSGETAFVIMTNTGGGISGTFGNAGDGDTIPAYDEGLVTPVGEFTVAISATAVTLHFVAPPGGTLLLLR